MNTTDTKNLISERPDLFDSADCMPGNSYPESQRTEVLPQHVRDLLEKKQANQPPGEGEKLSG